ncbi:molybdopterin-guanine dinucleotide biosynthesis protein B [Archaeoglobus veneficus]|uniref:Molybdopterin-guanine dinucleotide biosynthesis protein B n=1 Tax=Archaeoglobus veneficus (strain DSM 11195 / SNP6) TaxID=693661 RepID=F2KMH5_ARCVS|nr:molybdopterin-guanine dinucleotide biosynthesis protein B [Archaeoglobus veneficus]AEA47172.1 molybdopterin-guanine dinucleotide biosynthesis protein B [Archaeoglobus veneficus SNP6]
MIVLSIVGNSNSGKTTLITRIVPILKQRGFRVAVVKHTRDFEVDREGKDSWKIWQSGADVAIASNEKTALIMRGSKSLDEICRFFEGYDIVLTEGFSSAGKDRIVVLDESSKPEDFANGRIIAVVADRDVPGYRTFRRDDVDGIAELIVDILKGKNF